MTGNSWGPPHGRKILPFAKIEHISALSCAPRGLELIRNHLIVSLLLQGNHLDRDRIGRPAQPASVPDPDTDLVQGVVLQTRARKLIGVLADTDGRLYILDDKSYITCYEGPKLITNYFAGFSPSRYAVNSFSRGPEGSLLVTDAVGLMVNMYDLKTGEAIYSWRLPLKKKEFTTRARDITCLVDAILLIIIIVLVWRIMARVRRYQVYRKGDGKR